MVHPTSGHRISLQQPAVPSPRLMPGATPRRMVVPPPIPSTTPIRPSNKSHIATPTTRPPLRTVPAQPMPTNTPITAISRVVATPTTVVGPPLKMIPAQPKPGNTPIKAVPIASSPAVNIISPASIMAHIAANASFSVATSNPAISVSVTHPVSVAISNLVSINKPLPTVPSVVSVAADRIVTLNTPAVPAPVPKIRPSLQVVCSITCHC